MVLLVFRKLRVRLEAYLQYHHNITRKATVHCILFVSYLYYTRITDECKAIFIITIVIVLHIDIIY